MKKNYSLAGRQIAFVLFTAISLGLSCISYAQTTVINTIAGTNLGGYNGEGSPAVTKELLKPFGVAVDAAGNVYIADTYNHRVRKVTPAGVISTIAGTGSILPPYNGDGIAATTANLNYPYGVAVDAAGNVYIADSYNNRIRKVNTAGIISTIAGSGVSGYSGDGAAAISATLNNPTGVTVTPTGFVFVADYGNHVIRKIFPSGIISTVAGTGAAAFSGDGGSALAATLQNPYDVAVDAGGNIYIADWYWSHIRKVDAAGNISSIGGIGLIAKPSSVALDATGAFLYVANQSSNKIVKIDLATNISTVVAGTGASGFAGDGGAPLSAQFNNPSGIDVDASGNIYIGDAINNRVREITAATVSINPITGNLSVCVGGTDTLVDVAGGGAWTSGNPAAAVIDVSSGVVTGIASGTSIITYTNSTGSAMATVTVDPFPNVGKVLGLNTLCPGLTAILTETVPNGIWTSSDPTKASIASNGIVTAKVAGSVNIYYTVSNACGASGSAKYPFTVLSHTDCLAGVANTATGEANVINAWPNPSDGTFTVTLSSVADEAVQLVITNMVGEKVKEYSTKSNTSLNVRLDAPNGIYFLNAVSEHGMWNGKVLVSGAQRQ